jgi:hypothetical protein
MSVAEVLLASPELALVDSALAAELRQNLPSVEETWASPQAPVTTLAPIEAVAPVHDEPEEREDQVVGEDSKGGEESSGPCDSALEQVDLVLEQIAVVQEALEGPLFEADVREAENSRGADDLIVDSEPPPTNVQGEATTSHYPLLPSPVSGEGAVAETDAALQRIRERLAADELPARKRSLGRGFTVATATTAVCALAALAGAAQLGVAQLSWLQF